MIDTAVLKPDMWLYSLEHNGYIVLIKYKCTIIDEDESWLVCIYYANAVKDIIVYKNAKYLYETQEEAIQERQERWERQWEKRKK